MIIDNKQDRDPNDGINVKTVWDYMKYYTNPEKGREGILDIVTGFFSVTGLELLGKYFSPNNPDFDKMCTYKITYPNFQAFSKNNLCKWVTQRLFFVSLHHVCT